MAKLTKKQITFLINQDVSLHKVYDATGLSATVYKREMKVLGKEVAIGVTPCQWAGHTMRTRSGHCAQCNTHTFAFRRRFNEANYVYIAKSDKKRLLKIGVTNDTYRRCAALNSHGYGGAYDWNIAYHEYCERAGRIEAHVHNILNQRGYQINRRYIKQGYYVDCQELFRCPLKQVMITLKKSINSNL